MFRVGQWGQLLVRCLLLASARSFAAELDRLQQSCAISTQLERHDKIRGNTRHCGVTPASEVGIKEEMPKPKTPRLELEFQAVGPVDACERHDKIWGNTRHCGVTPAGEVGIKEEMPKPKTPRLELEFQAVGPVDACEVSAMCTASSRFRKLEEQGSTMRRPTDRIQVPLAHSVKYAWVVYAKKVLSKSRPSVLASVP
ncbi:hypothetical protein MRX96_023425 [Rhipicephalus microplus]